MTTTAFLIVKNSFILRGPIFQKLISNYRETHYLAATAAVVMER
jgi:hypothetical protein